MTTESVSKRLHYTEAVEEMWELVRRQLMGAPGPVLNVAEHLSQNTGKGIRTLLLAGCAMDGDGMITSDAIHAAASIELLHMATLVHDDIIDDTPIRRGMASVQSKFGKEVAVLGGDWILCLAISQAVSIEQVPDGLSGQPERVKNMARLLVKSAEKVCLGELAQRAEYQNVDLTPSRYMRIIDKKTAALFNLSAHVGSIIGGCSEKETAALLRYATYLGLVFQIMDDIKDYTMEECDALKPVKNDLLSGVITIPLIMAFMREPMLKPLAQSVIQSRMGIVDFIEKVRDAGGIEDAQSLAQSLGDKALKQLEKLSSPYKRDVLSELLRLSLCAAKKF